MVSQKLLNDEDTAYNAGKAAAQDGRSRLPAFDDIFMSLIGNERIGGKTERLGKAWLRGYDHYVLCHISNPARDAQQREEG